MELNLIATGIELLGASVAKLTVDNTIVDIDVYKRQTQYSSTRPALRAAAHLLRPSHSP